MKKIYSRNIVYRIIPCTALVLMLCMALCSCGFVNFVVGYGSGVEETTEIIIKKPIGSNGEQVTDLPEATREKVDVEKSEGIVDDGDRLTSAGQAYNSISEVYYSVADSVVEITTETVQNSIWMGQYVSEGAGSGVIINKNGYIVTNNHVVEGANNVTVRLTDGSEYKASFIGADASADLAIIKIDPSGKNLTAARLGCSAELVVGEDIAVIGNPLGSLGGTLTTGIISATERNITVDGEDMVLLQTNAAINPGNSGGGLFNMAGELVGVVNAKMAGEDIEGLGFAIPIDFAHGIIEDLINYGYVRGVADHGLILLDVTAQNLPAAYRKYGITTTGVAIIDSTLTDDLKCGHVIVSIGGVAVGSVNDVERVVKSSGVGDKVRIVVKRGSDTVAVTLVLAEKGPNTVSFD